MCIRDSIHHGVLHRTHRDGEGAAGKLCHRQMLFAAGFHGVEMCIRDRAEILRNARKEQLKNRMQYGELYHKNYYREVKDKNRVYYEFYHLDGTEEEVTEQCRIENYLSNEKEDAE